ncbi:hypothetical protein HIDPHFAB_03125 [Nocardioides sp. T2.26MG-1]|nr:hypothetical protein HIDPHFAB_03125 [Nocardioides sp. T2.26MG-1]
MRTRPIGVDVGNPRSEFGDFEGTRFLLPFHWPDLDAYMAVFRASMQAARQMLPSDGLVPVRWLDGSALVVVEAARANLFAARLEGGEVRQAAPFGMVHAALLVARSDPGPAPMAFSRRRSARHRLGALQLAFPITSPIGAAVGKVAFGEAKFVADMSFVEGTSERSVTVTEDGELVLRLAVMPRGPVTRYSADVWLYMAPGDELLSMAAPAKGYRQFRLGRRAASLDVGDHPAAASLRALAVDRRPVMSMNFLQYAFDQYAVEPVAPCRPLAYYSNAAERAAYTVEYEGLGVIDVHTGLSDALLRDELIHTQP